MVAAPIHACMSLQHFTYIYTRYIFLQLHICAYINTHICFLYVRNISQHGSTLLAPPRLGLPAKPQINCHSLNLKGDDYAELSSRFKASAVKVLVWFLACESQKYADQKPTATSKLFGMFV